MPRISFFRALLCTVLSVSLACCATPGARPYVPQRNGDYPLPDGVFPEGRIIDCSGGAIPGPKGVPICEPEHAGPPAPKPAEPAAPCHGWWHCANDYLNHHKAVSVVVFWVGLFAGESLTSTLLRHGHRSQDNNTGSTQCGPGQQCPGVNPSCYLNPCNTTDPNTPFCIKPAGCP